MFDRLFCGIKKQSGFDQQFYESGQSKIEQFSNLKFQTYRDINDSLLPTETDAAYQKQNKDKNGNSICDTSHLKWCHLQGNNTVETAKKILVISKSSNDLSKNKQSISDSTVNQNLKQTAFLSQSIIPSQKMEQMPLRSFDRLGISSIKPSVVISESHIENVDKINYDTEQSTLSVPTQKYLIQDNRRLTQQNLQLKKVLFEQYLPLRKCYESMKKNQQNREYLITQLQYQIRELKKQMKDKREKNL